MMVPAFIWFGFLSCVENPESTTKLSSEQGNDIEVEAMETKESMSIKMALRIPKNARVELIDGIAIEYSPQHIHTTDGSTEGTLIGELTADVSSTSFELELEPHSFQEIPIGGRLIRLSATGFYDFGLQVEVLDNRLEPLTFDEVQKTFEGLGMGATCGELKRSKRAWNGVWSLRTKGRCRVGIGQYSGSVLYIKYPQSTDVKE